MTSDSTQTLEARDLEQEDRERLASLGYAEAELSSILGEAADRVGDPQIAVRVRDMAHTHRRHAEELQRLACAGTTRCVVDERVRRSLSAVRRGTRHAKGQDGLVEALREAERAEDDRYFDTLERDLPDEAQGLLRAQEVEVRDAVRLLEETAPGLAPEIGDGGVGRYGRRSSQR